MTWEILSFEGMGPIRFGMTPADVEAILGTPDRSRKGLRPGVLNENRSTRAPIVTYRNNEASEIEADARLVSLCERLEVCSPYPEQALPGSRAGRVAGIMR